MSGATTPLSGGGTLALLNAELLAGLVFSQLVHEGSKIILGSLPAVFDMQNMISQYNPQAYLINLCCAEMMEYYSVPHCGTSGSGIGWGADINAAGDQWMNHLSAVMSSAGMHPFIGGNFDSKAFSPALVIMADEIIRKSRDFAKGFSVDMPGSGIDEIINLGPGADFLTAGSTLESLNDQSQGPGIWPAMSLDKWIAEGKPHPHDYFENSAKLLWDTAKQQSQESEEIRIKGETLIRSLRDK